MWKKNRNHKLYKFQSLGGICSYCNKVNGIGVTYATYNILKYIYETPLEELYKLSVDTETKKDIYKILNMIINQNYLKKPKSLQILNYIKEEIKMEITLEKIDIIRERTGATYTEAKEALEACEGNVVDALVYMENKVKEEKEELYTTKDELVKWIKDIIKKGNVTRIKSQKRRQNYSRHTG